MARRRGGAKEFRRWRFDMGKLSERQAVQLHQKVHIQTADALIFDTPVGNPDLWKSPPPKGYVGGRARGNWQSSIGSLPGKRGEAEQIAAIDKGGGATNQQNQAVALRVVRPTRTYIANHVPWIKRLNDAPQWSKQQAPHWVERGIQRVTEQFH